jgi:hypothetical protein
MAVFPVPGPPVMMNPPLVGKVPLKCSVMSLKTQLRPMKNDPSGVSSNLDKGELVCGKSLLSMSLLTVRQKCK